MKAKTLLPALFSALLVGSSAAAGEPALPKADGAIRVVLPDGAQVEFLAVGDVPADEKSWWRPDGIPLEHPPTHDAFKSQQPPPNTFERAFIFRTLTDGTLFTPPRSIDPYAARLQTSYRCNGKRRIAGRILEEEHFIATMPIDARATFVRDYVDSRWKTVSTTEQRGGTTTQKSASGCIVWDKPVEENDGFRMSVTYRIADDFAQICAIDKNNHEHFPGQYQHIPG
jgi:hypothetical protein